MKGRHQTKYLGGSAAHGTSSRTGTGAVPMFIGKPMVRAAALRHNLPMWNYFKTSGVYESVAKDAHGINPAPTEAVSTHVPRETRDAMTAQKARSSKRLHEFGW